MTVGLFTPILTPGWRLCCECKPGRASKAVKHDPDLDFVRQLVVFQDGTVAYSWIREGALCMK